MVLVPANRRRVPPVQSMLPVRTGHPTNEELMGVAWWLRGGYTEVESVRLE